MDFNDTPQEAEFRAKARKWLQENATPRTALGSEYESLGERVGEAELAAAKAWQKKKADAGWACIHWPRAFGGRDAMPIETVIWNQEEAKFKTPPNIYLIGHGMAGPTLMIHGNAEQQERWLPKMLSGEEVWCQLFSEPGAGSDLGGLRMSAVREGDYWVANGQKIWTTGAQFCDWGILVARHDPNLPKHSGLTYFVVDMRSPGIEIRPITQIDGGQGFNEVFFTDVRIPDSNRIGEVGEGWRVAITTLMNERASVGALGGDVFGTADLLDLASRLQVNGAPALADDAVREKIASLHVVAKGIELTGRRILSDLSQGRMPGPEASLMKLLGARLIQDMACYAMDLQGEAGAIAGTDDALHHGRWQHLYLAISGFRIAGGTDEILRNIIAERVLGLPAEARADKGIAFKDIPSGS